MRFVFSLKTLLSYYQYIITITITITNVLYLIVFDPITYQCVVVFFTLTDRASTILSNIRGCEPGTSSQRGTKVNGSHYGDNPLLRPTGIQIGQIRSNQF